MSQKNNEVVFAKGKKVTITGGVKNTAGFITKELTPDVSIIAHRRKGVFIKG